MFSRFRINVSFDIVSHKYIGYTLEKVFYADELDYQYEEEERSEVICREKSLPEILIRCDLEPDVELINRETWEKRVEDDDFVRLFLNGVVMNVYL